MRNFRAKRRTGEEEKKAKLRELRASFISPPKSFARMRQYVPYVWPNFPKFDKAHLKFAVISTELRRNFLEIVLTLGQVSDIIS